MNHDIVTQAKGELEIKHEKGKAENHTEFRKISLLTSWESTHTQHLSFVK